MRVYKLCMTAVRAGDTTILINIINIKLSHEIVIYENIYNNDLELATHGQNSN